MNYIGGNLRDLREAVNMTPESAAEKIGVTGEELRGWESGKTRADVAALEKIASAYGVDITDVIYGSREIDKKRKVMQRTACITLGIIAVCMIVATEILLPYLREYVNTYFNMYPAIIYSGLWLPAVYAITALAILSGASLIWDFRIQNITARRTVLWVSLIILLFLIIYPIIDYLIIYYGSFAHFVFGYPVLFLIPAALLHLGAKK